MLRKGGAAGYGFGGGGLGSHELPRPNGSSYSGGGLGGGKKSSAARRKRLLLRLGSLGVVVLFLIVLVARSRGGGTKGGAATTTTAGLHLDGEDVPAQHMKAEDTAAAAEKSAQAILRDHPQAYGASADALDGGLDARDSWVEHLSWSPRASLHHAFLTRRECEHLIALARPHMEPSTVVDNVSGERQPSKVRTSSGMFLQRGADEIVARIEDKIAAATGIPASHGEGLQVLLYEDGQRYEPHFDYFHEQVNQANGGQRIATMLMYLSDVESGGETVFDAAEDLPTRPPADPAGLSACAKKNNGTSSLAVRPRAGDALLFWSLRPDGSLDHASLHGGCPVLKGKKWSATKWLRVQEYKV